MKIDLALCERVNCNNGWDTMAWVDDAGTGTPEYGGFYAYICWDCFNDEPFAETYDVDDVIYGGDARVG